MYKKDNRRAFFIQKWKIFSFRSSFEIDGNGLSIDFVTIIAKKREMFDLDPFTRDTNRARVVEENGNRFLINFQTKAVSKAVQKTDNSSLLPPGIHGIHRPRLALCPATKRTRLEIEIGREWNGREWSEVGGRGRVNIRELTGKCNSCIAVSVIDVLQRKPVPRTLYAAAFDIRTTTTLCRNFFINRFVSLFSFFFTITSL